MIMYALYVPAMRLWRLLQEKGDNVSPLCPERHRFLLKWYRPLFERGLEVAKQGAEVF